VSVTLLLSSSLNFSQKVLKSLDFLLVSKHVWLQEEVEILCNTLGLEIHEIVYLLKEFFIEFFNDFSLSKRSESHGHLNVVVQSHVILLVLTEKFGPDSPLTFNSGSRSFTECFGAAKHIRRVSSSQNSHHLLLNFQINRN
jgi:hypothetical protein